MIAVVLFYLHTIFAVYAFCKSYQDEGILQAFLNVGFIVILFSVGWTISDLLTGLIISENGYLINMPKSLAVQAVLKLSGFFTPLQGKGILYPKDSVSLIALSITEFYFYKFFFKEVTSHKK
ncbi:hypothetical protein BH10BAC5_BH10BAC5_14780 [soil metagenome]